MMHEYVHFNAHPQYEFYAKFKVRANAKDKEKKQVEMGGVENEKELFDLENYDPGYYDEIEQAKEIESIIGFQNILAAYFMGHKKCWALAKVIWRLKMKAVLHHTKLLKTLL